MSNDVRLDRPDGGYRLHLLGIDPFAESRLRLALVLAGLLDESLAEFINGMAVDDSTTMSTVVLVSR